MSGDSFSESTVEEAVLSSCVGAGALIPTDVEIASDEPAAERLIGETV